MANSSFVVINAVHNNAHGESVLLVSSLCVLIILLHDCGSHFRSGTHGWPK